MLRLGNPEDGLELLRLHHLGEERAGRHPLPKLQRQLGEDPAIDGAHLHRIDLLAPEGDHGLEPLDLRHLSGHLLLAAARHHAEPLALDLETARQLLGALHLLPRLHFADDAVLGQLLIGLGATLRIGGLGLERGESGARDERVAVGGGAEVDQVCLRLGELALGIERLQHHVRVGQLHQHRSGLDLRARPQRDPLHAARGVRGDQTDLLGNQRPRAFDLAQHRAALHQTPERSTTGAAARSLERPNVMAANAAATLTPMIRLRFRVFRGLRGMSTTLGRGSILEISGCIG